MKPVEIEIFLQDGLTPGLEKASRSLEALSGTSRRAMSELNTRVRESKSLIRDMEGDIRKLERSLDSATPGTPQFGNLQSELSAARRALEEEQNALQEYQGNLEAAMAARQQQGGSLRTQLRETREEIATLLLAYRSLTDAEKQTAQGRELARHIDELTEKAGELNDALADTSQAVNNAASDTRAFDQLAGGMQLVVDGFGLATAGAQALGLSEADLLEVQTRLQTALVASNALTSAQTNLQRQSALMQGVSVIQTKAAAAAENTRTWAVGRGVIATKAATVAQAAFNTVAKANPYVVLAAAVVTVVGALYAFAKGSSEAKKAEEERQAQLERGKEINEGIARSIGESAGSQIAAYNKLQRAWKTLGDDMIKRRKFVDENKKAFQELGLSVNSVKDAEEVLVNNTSNVVQSFVLRAKAAALDKAVTQAYSTMLEKQDLARRNARYNVKSNGDRISYSEAQQRGMAGVRVVTHEHYTRRGSYRPTYTYEVSDADAYNAASNRLAIEERNRQIQAASDEADRRVGELQKEIGATEAALDAIKIPQMTTPTTPPNTDKPAPSELPKDNRLENERRVFEELQKLRWQNEQEEIDRMADGSKKRRRQVDLDYEKELAEVKKQRQAFAAANSEAGTEGLNAAGLTEDQQEEIDRANRLAVESRYRALQEISALEDRQMAEYLMKYGTFQQKREATAQEYDRKIAEAPDEWSRKVLEKEKADALQKIGVEELKDSMDWESVFGDLDKVSTDGLKTLREQLKEYISTQKDLSPDVLKELVQAVDSIDAKVNERNPFTHLRTSVKSLSTASKELKTAQDAYNKALENGTEEEKKNAQATLNAARNAKQKALADATDALHDSVGKVKEYLGVAEDLMGLAEQFGIDPPEWLEGYLEGTAQILDGLESIDLTKPMSVISGGIKALGGAVKQVASLGGLIPGMGESDRDLERDLEYLTASNNDLRKSIDNLADKMEEAAVSDATELYEEQKNRLEQSEANTREAMQRSGAAYKGGIGGKHSSDYYINKGMSGADWDRISAIVGRRIDHAGAFWGLSSEEMAKVFDQANDLYTKIKSLADDGYKDAGQYMDQYIEYSRQLEELRAAYYEKLTGISFDSVRDDFKSKLLDMGSDAETFADNLNEIMMNSLVESMMSETYTKKLRDWYRKFAEAMEDGEMSDIELDALRREYQEIVNDALRDRDALADTLGIDPDKNGGGQSGRAGSFNAMSQEQGTKLEGLFVSVQGHVANIDTAVEDVVEKMNRAESYLAEIADNTKSNAKSAEEIRDMIKQMLRDGIKLN